MDESTWPRPATLDPVRLGYLALASIIELGSYLEPGNGPLSEALVRRYQEPQRHHHTLEHVAEVLELLRTVGGGDSDCVREVAAWYHDAVYDPTAPDNELRSAELAVEELTAVGVHPPTAERVADYVLATAGHDAPPGDASIAGFLDADLAILGAPPERYDRYVVAVRAEYGHVPDDAWRPGRAAVLRTFADRPRLFVTDDFHERFDRAARENLRRELQSLAGGDG